MDQKTFEHEMFRADGMRIVEPERQDYWIGYQRGLRRAYHGEKFGTDQEHRQWLAAGLDSVDETRKQRGEGYRDGLNVGGVSTSEETAYLLKIDSDTWAQFRSKCSLQKIKIKDCLAQLIHSYISQP